MQPEANLSSMAIRLAFALLHDALDESGYTVIVATSGETALAVAAQAHPDIVLLNAVMPVILGG
jgi:DNA-binding response OmpR family regulator